MDLFNRLKVDLVVPGNHEFDFTPGNLVERVKESNFKWICSNIETPEGKIFEAFHEIYVLEVKFRIMTYFNVNYFF